MASTNVTNIKNAFTLSDTLGGNAGNQTSKDPTSNIDPTNANYLITLKTQKINFGDITTTNTIESVIAGAGYQSVEEAVKTKEGQAVIIQYTNTINTISANANLELFYNTGWYSTIKNNTLPPGTQKPTSYYIVDKVNARGNNPPGTPPNDISIADKLYEWLDDIFLQMSQKMVKEDFENTQNTFKFDFASQESALPNSDEEKAGPPPTISPFNPAISTAGGLANARFVWMQWFINEYVKNLDQRFTSKNYYASYPNLKSIVPLFSSTTSKLKVNVNKKIVLPYTPFGSSKLEEGAPKKFNVPLVFQNGTANQALYGTRGENISDRTDFKLPDYIKQNATPGSTPQSLLDQLKARYGGEQKSVLRFTGVVKYIEDIPRCNTSKIPSEFTQGKAPNFKNILPFKTSAIPAAIKPNFRLSGDPRYIPDRFGDASKGQALPYFLANFKKDTAIDLYKDGALFIWGLFLRIVDKAFPNSEAFKGINYLSTFRNKKIYDYFYEESNSAPTNPKKKIYKVFNPGPGIPLVDFKTMLGGGGNLQDVLINGRTQVNELQIGTQYRIDTPRGARIPIHSLLSISIPNLATAPNMEIKEYGATARDLWELMRTSPQLKPFIENFLENKIVDVREYTKDNSFFPLPDDDKGIISYGIFGNTVYQVDLICGRR